MNPFLVRLPPDCRLRTHGATEDSYQKGMGSRFRMTSRHRSGVFLPEGSCVNGMENKIFFFFNFQNHPLYPVGRVHSELHRGCQRQASPWRLSQLGLPAAISSPPAFSLEPTQPALPVHIHGPGKGAGTATPGPRFLLPRSAACFGPPPFGSHPVFSSVPTK